MRAPSKDDAVELSKLLTTRRAEWAEWKSKARGDNILVYVPIAPWKTSPKSRIRSRRTPLIRTGSMSSSGSAYSGGSNCHAVPKCTHLKAPPTPATFEELNVGRRASLAGWSAQGDAAWRISSRWVGCRRFTRYSNEVGPVGGSLGPWASTAERSPGTPTRRGRRHMQPGRLPGPTAMAAVIRPPAPIQMQPGRLPGPASRMPRRPMRMPRRGRPSSPAAVNPSARSS